MEQKKGILSKEDIITELLNDELQIIPFKKDNLTDLGYNLTSSDFVFSTNKGILLEIIVTDTEKYVCVPPCDTILILTREYVSVGKRIMGTFHSRVRVVSEGFGHISTTLDPGWRGPLLFAVNNPSRKKKRFVLQSNNGKGMMYVSFATMILAYLATPIESVSHDNMAFRIDILQQYYNATGYIRKKFNQSFQLLDEIIEMTQKISPDIPTQDVSTNVNDQMQEHLINSLNAVEKDNDWNNFINNLKVLEYGYIIARKNASFIFKKQIDIVLREANNANPSQEDRDYLIFKVKMLIHGCHTENKRIRWMYYTNSMEEKISKYRIGIRMRIIMFFRKDLAIWTISLLIGICLAAALYFCTFDKTTQKLVETLVPVLVSALLGQTFLLLKRTNK